MVKNVLKGLGGVVLILTLAGLTLSAQGYGEWQLSEPGEWNYIYLPAVEKPQLEWTYHRTLDGQHPNGDEQQLMWLMNRARANPTQEGIWLATTTEQDIAFPRSYFGVSLSVLQSEFASYVAKPPAAFDVRLYIAAKAHSDDLIARNAQDHINQFQRVKDAGYVYRNIRGNVFSYTRNGLYGHAGFNIDWGGSPDDGDATNDGMQPGRGHRKAIMALDGDYCNVGLAVVPVTVPNKSVGPYVTTGNYAYPNLTTPNQYCRFIVGTVWQDRNGNGLYNPGDGYGGVTVRVRPGDFFAITSSGGGYAVPILEPGTYTVTFSGVVNGVQQVVVGTSSVLVDWKVPTGSLVLDESSPLFLNGEHPPVAPPPGISE